MGIPISQPHSVVVVTAAVARDADHNAATQDFSGASRSVKGMFQTRSGDLIQDETGKLSTLDGIFYTTDQSILVDDLITVALPGISEKFRVSSRSVKMGIDGGFSHVQHDLVKEIKR